MVQSISLRVMESIKLTLVLALDGDTNGADNRLKNPFSYLDDSFNNRPDEKIGYVYDNKGEIFKLGGTSQERIFLLFLAFHMCLQTKYF